MAMQSSPARYAGQTLVQKILRKHLVEGAASRAVRPGDYVSLRPWRTLTHDNTFAVIQKFKAVGGASMRDPRQMIFALDHDIQNESAANLARYAAIEAFAKEQDVDFYPAGRGIGHQIMVEELYAEPGSLCMASDSHSNMYGGVGCLGTPMVRTDAASVWATGRTWWRVPPVVHVELVGQLPEGCSGKDVIIALCGFLNDDQVLNRTVEFGGDGVAGLSIEDRLTIANMSTEWGALCGLFPIDDQTTDWWQARADIVERERPGAVVLPSARDRAVRAKKLVEELKAVPLRADEDADYEKRFIVDLSKLSPLITGGNTMKSALLAAANPLRIDKAWLVSCVNARSSDIAAAAHELRGRRVADHVEFYVAAASSEVQADAELAGNWQVLLDAGAIVLPPGCGACAGLGAGTIKSGEVGIAATNRNFKGRMGHRDGTVYLSSPAVVAASAAEGRIVPPKAQQGAVSMSEACTTELTSVRGAVTDRTHEYGAGEVAATDTSVDLVAGFPHSLQGEVLWCGADNISTDGVYHGKHMYNQLSPEEMADVAMENYDPSFTEVVRAVGTPILVSSQNFGTGSSREQAAVCFRHLGIPALIATSYSATYTRNALNNGLPIFESPELADYLRQRFGSGTEASIDNPTVRTGLIARLDLTVWTVDLLSVADDLALVGRFKLVPVGQAAQELIACGGLEPWIAKQLST
eukprot:TRINITY_DN49135_c0_g1_i1.p1 TRINITY_DN49135_c0_g1~~TRINITY_DN49135_c0_g1_i1.p1  ORF type:complete len:696 (-),score=86.57 TRINITY_DN49135_c0_g1_i1:19-2106(-)